LAAILDFLIIIIIIYYTHYIWVLKVMWPPGARAFSRLPNDKNRYEVRTWCMPPKASGRFPFSAKYREINFLRSLSFQIRSFNVIRCVRLLVFQKKVIAKCRSRDILHWMKIHLYGAHALINFVTTGVKLKILIQ
jgi:hypothetical protein